MTDLRHATEADFARKAHDLRAESRLLAGLFTLVLCGVAYIISEWSLAALAVAFGLIYYGLLRSDNAARMEQWRAIREKMG